MSRRRWTHASPARASSALLVLAFAAAGGACSEAGRSIVLVDLSAADALGPPAMARVRVVVWQAGRTRRWPVEHAWSGQPLAVGVFLPREVSGDVTVVACGLSGDGDAVAIADAAGPPVKVEPGTVSTPVPVNLVPGAPTGPGDGCIDVTPLPATGPGGPTLTVVPASHPPTVDLTAEGTVDWAHWGPIGPVDTPMGDTGTAHHKATGGRKIGDINDAEYIVAGTLSCFWSDGVPDAVAGSEWGGYDNYFDGVGQPFLLNVQASTTPRTLRLYLGADGAATLTAHLSDGSAPDAIYDGEIPRNDLTLDITFRAASDGQKLSLRWAMNAATTGSIFMTAATLR